MRTAFSDFRRQDPIVWIRVIGTGLCALTTFMIRPFLVFYISDKLGGTVMMPLLVVGLQPLAGIVLSFWGGGLADRYGRKPVMLISLTIQAISMLGFIFADTLWMLILISILGGMGMPMFLPAANAQISDIVPEEKRAGAFALIHGAVNVGGALGPLLGLGIYLLNQNVVFVICSASFLLFALLIGWRVPETRPQNLLQSDKSSVHSIRLPYAKHKLLYRLTLFALPIGLLYSQVETTLPLHLKTNFANASSVFAGLMTINSVVVILLMLWLPKKTGNKSSHSMILISCLLFAAVSLGYGWASSFLVLVAIELIFTVGEIIGIIHLQKYVSIISPEGTRGRYNSVFGLYMQIPRIIGPIFFGLIFEYFGGRVMFSVISVLLIICGFTIYHLIHNAQHQEINPMQKVPRTDKAV
ncbi:MFS transporter [Saccharibacillus sp. CPCC 101409]|uniref:MDR family MFS transporter n=1 Tax=Saccharibacillus sp. CPCC 101409 TaxID=3058041 RepID=UPI002672EC51|nr:MFS transporter [Saccharibacillus sp. CPCC 101409]MDO3409725.1 MFS transporter [Saccharibacillus sp. CPCC 101409]